MNDVEFEKNRQEILRNAKINNKNTTANNKEHLWKYEIENIGNKRKKSCFLR
jgi:hypothetical protein